MLRPFNLLVAIVLCFVTNSYAQRPNYEIKNGIGVYGGLTQFNFATENFETQTGKGWLIGGSATVDLPHKGYNFGYMIQITENHFGINARPESDSEATEFVNYDAFAVQLGLLYYIKLIQSNLTLDIGPLLHFNGALALEDKKTYGDYIITGYNALKTSDITKISSLNFDTNIGLSAGFGRFKIGAHYIYGIGNSFGKLNKQDLEAENAKFKGNPSLFTFTAQVAF